MHTSFVDLVGSAQNFLANQYLAETDRTALSEELRALAPHLAVTAEPRRDASQASMTGNSSCMCVAGADLDNTAYEASQASTTGNSSCMCVAGADLNDTIRIGEADATWPAATCIRVH